MKKTFARVCSLLLVAVMLFSLSSCVIVKVPDGDIKAEFNYFDINLIISTKTFSWLLSLRISWRYPS